MWNRSKRVLQVEADCVGRCHGLPDACAQMGSRANQWGGAAKHGGRANRPGVEALYLALEMETAVREYQQVSTLLPPGTLTSYQLTAAPVVDFTAGYSASTWEPIWEDFYCDWRELWFNQRVEPPSWIVGDAVIAAGAKGILFPSRLAKGGTNLVLFTHMLAAPDVLEVFDPGKALPQTQASWR